MIHVTYYFLWLTLIWDLTSTILRSICRDTRDAFQLPTVIGRLCSEDGCIIFRQIVLKMSTNAGSAMYSLGLEWLIRNHSTRVGPVRSHWAVASMFDRKWNGSESAPDCLNRRNHIRTLWSLTKYLTGWSVASGDLGIAHSSYLRRVGLIIISKHTTSIRKFLLNRWDRLVVLLKSQGLKEICRIEIDHINP